MAELRNWTIEYKNVFPNVKILVAKGDCYHSVRFPDGKRITTSELMRIFKKERGLTIFTQNTEYFCPYESALLSGSDIENYVKKLDKEAEEAALFAESVFGTGSLDISEESYRVETTMRTHAMERFTLDKKSGFFHRIADRESDAIVIAMTKLTSGLFLAIGIRRGEFTAISEKHIIHTGTLADSILIGSVYSLEESDKVPWQNIDLRYRPSTDRNVQFYMCKTDNLPVYVLNYSPDPLSVRFEGSNRMVVIKAEGCEKIYPG